MKKKIVLRLSNEIGNQMFMYASAFAISKDINRSLYIDNETAFISKKNVSNYGLDGFRITSVIAPDNLKFKSITGYIKRKFLKKTDKYKKIKNFFIEKKDKNKISEFSDKYKKINFNDIMFLEGHFESEKYFCNYKKEIENEFKFKNTDNLQKNPFFKDIAKKNSVSFCVRQNRFSEGRDQNTPSNKDKSWKFTLEQINYINRGVDYIKSKIPNPTFFMWSNDFTNLNEGMFNFPYKEIRPLNSDKIIDKRIQSLYLLTNCNHFIVTTSTFNWWGAWLASANDKIILRPSNKFFNDFYLNNKNFWPKNWNIIND